jgi:hypothetical protein
VQRVKKTGQPGPIKANIHAVRAKQEGVIFFDAKGIIYTHYFSRGKTNNAKDIKKALARSLVVFQKKSSSCRPGTGSFTNSMYVEKQRRQHHRPQSEVPGGKA